MANAWVRLWVDMPTDPKFRTIAKVSKQPLSAVIAVFVFLLADAANTSERGVTQCDAENVASALDLEIADVEAVIAAMQGRVLEGNKLRGWEKRQPVREDNSAERTRTWREKKRAETQCDAEKRSVTQCDAPDTDTDIEYKNLSASGDAGQSDDWVSKRKRKLVGKRLDAFKRFWLAFDLKRGRAEAIDAWLDIPQLTTAMVDRIVVAAEREALARPDLLRQGRTPKWAQGWLAARRWEDEGVGANSDDVSAPVYSPVTAGESDALRRALDRYEN